MSINISSKVYGDLSGSIFEPQVISIANVSTGLLPINCGGTGLNIIGNSGSFLASNGSSLTYINATGINASEVSSAINQVTSSLSSAFIQKSGGTFTGPVTASAGFSSSFYLLSDGIQLSSSNQLGIKVSNFSAGDTLVYKQNIQYFSSSWYQQQILSGSRAIDYDNYFGNSVNFNSTGNKIIIGAPGDEASGRSTASGLAYIFSSSSAGWYEEAILSGSLSLQNSDWFGFYAILNPSGNKAIISAPYDERTDLAYATNSGLVYVFSSSSAGWYEEAVLSGSLATSAYDFFGKRVQGNSAFTKLVVGAQGDEKSGGADGSGLAYVFTSSSAGWYEEAVLSGSLATAANDYFGISVVIDSSGNKILVGASGDESPSGEAGAGIVYVFATSSAGWYQEAILSGSLTTALDQFGETIAINSIGNKALIGAPDHNITGPGSNTTGLAYIFASSSAGWYEEAVLSGSLATSPDDKFSNLSVAMNSLGNMVLIGAWQDERLGGAASSGLAYLFTSSSLGWSQNQIFSGSLATDANDYFGLSVTINSTGDRVAVGSQWDERPTGNSNTGLAYVFDLIPEQNIITNSWAAQKILSGSYVLSGTLQFVPQSILPSGSYGEFSVSGTNLYFHDGGSWRAVVLI